MTGVGPVHGGVLALLGAAVTSFLATNLDGLAVLAPLLWSTPGGGRRVPVLFGCCVGNAVVLVLALVAAAGLSTVPENQMHWIGLLPIGIGVYRLVPRRGQGSTAALKSEADAPGLAVELAQGEVADAADPPGAAVLTDAADVSVPGSRSDPTAGADLPAPVDLPTSRVDNPAEPRPSTAPAKVFFAYAGLTVALGGDNIAVLAPLLRALGPGGSAVITAAHLVLFPLFLILPTLVARSAPVPQRLARTASACLSIVIGIVIVAS